MSSLFNPRPSKGQQRATREATASAAKSAEAVEEQNKILASQATALQSSVDAQVAALEKPPVQLEVPDLPPPPTPLKAPDAPTGQGAATAARRLRRRGKGLSSLILSPLGGGGGAGRTTLGG